MKWSLKQVDAHNIMAAAASKAFFHQFTTILDQLVDMFPEDADFPSFKMMVGLMQKTNPAFVIQTFYDNVSVPYSVPIDEKNESFIVNYSAEGYDESGMDVIEKIKRYWSVLSPATKDSIWQYLKVLKELSKRATGKTD